MDIIHAAGMDETYGTYVDDECLDIYDYDDDTDHDAADDNDDDTANDTNDDTGDDTDDGGRGNLYAIEKNMYFFSEAAKLGNLRVSADFQTRRSRSI